MASCKSASVNGITLLALSTVRLQDLGTGKGLLKKKGAGYSRWTLRGQVPPQEVGIPLWLPGPELGSPFRAQTSSTMDMNIRRLNSLTVHLLVRDV